MTSLTFREHTSDLTASLPPEEQVHVYSDAGSGLVRISIRNGEQELTRAERLDLQERLAEAGIAADEALVANAVASPDLVDPCACGSDATSLNPAEVVVHRPAPESCYIARAEQ